ncbi:MAG: hypothetical protein ACI9XO_000803 [Paraglaciecola sp.]|jgi:hypothetical protein
MNIRDELLADRSKANILRIAQYVGDSSELFQTLVDLFLKDIPRVNQRAVWVMVYCAEAHPVLIYPHLKKLLDNLQNPEAHNAARRNTIKILSEIDIPKKYQGQALDICFNFLLSMQEHIAVKVFSMQVIFNISKNEPDLLRELAAVIEDQLPYGSTGFKSRGNKILNKIQQVLLEKI